MCDTSTLSGWTAIRVLFPNRIVIFAALARICVYAGKVWQYLLYGSRLLLCGHFFLSAVLQCLLLRYAMFLALEICLVGARCTSEFQSAFPNVLAATCWSTIHSCSSLLLIYVPRYCCSPSAFLAANSTCMGCVGLLVAAALLCRSVTWPASFVRLALDGTVFSLEGSKVLRLSVSGFL